MTGATSASPFADGATVGIGSLPHRDAAAAAAFAISEFDVATIPSLPRRSAAEGMIAQALVGVSGVGVAHDGSIDLTGGADPAAPVVTRLADDAFVGMREFLELARRVRLDGAPVKWQLTGPVTLGVALQRSGLETGVAFELATRVVRSRIADLATAIAQVLPNSAQLVLLDEPSLVELMSAEFPIPPDEAIDAMSTCMAAAPAAAVTGIHCCGPCDVATLIAAGPRIISVPVSPALLDWAGYLDRFLDEGGVVAWGAVATDGPVPVTAERPWRELSDLWCGLVQRGGDPVALRRQSLVSPVCGLTAHAVSVARRIARLAAEVGKRVNDQSTATRFALGA